MLLRRRALWNKIHFDLFLVVGALSSFWYLLRALPLPARTPAPCQPLRARAWEGRASGKGGGGGVCFSEGRRRVLRNMIHFDLILVDNVF
jgi:hypothetical protein